MKAKIVKRAAALVGRKVKRSKSRSEKGARLCRRPAAAHGQVLNPSKIRGRLRLVEDDTAALRDLQTGAKARAPRQPAKLWQLRLYVVDSTPKSLVAFANLKKFCETHLKGLYRITVIDLLKHPQLAKGDQILAIPTVVRKLPKPVRTLIGTLSDTESMIVGLDLRPAA